jgi:hypothetical protein
MNPNTTTLASKKELSTLARPHYSPGLLLNDDDLSQAVDYTRDLSRLLFRSMLGCGVVCGLVVSADTECGKLVVKVAPGLALDGHGDPVHVKPDQSVPIDLSCNVSKPTRLWVLLRRFDKYCMARSTVCAPDDDEAPSVYTRLRDGFEISVVSERPACICGCAEPVATTPTPMPTPTPTPPPPTDTDTDGKPAAASMTGAKAEASKNVSKKHTVNGTSATTATSSTGGASNPGGASSPDGTNGMNAATQGTCYEPHVAGVCACACQNDEAWIVLARLDAPATQNETKWRPDHSVRRFIRPALLVDPQPAIDRKTS